jgi:predicted HTH transcriptional regulator
MNFREIKAMVKAGENDFLEFKRKVRYPEKIVKEIVAFANTRGGNLLIGVDDNGTIPGLKFAEEEAFVLENAIHQYCFPRIRYLAETVSLPDDKSVIRYRIYESRKKPHYVLEPEANGRKKVYIRIGDKSIQASREIIEILKRSRSKRGVGFHFGEKERVLMQYLDKHDSITMDDFSRVAGISRKIASKTLIWLVLASVLMIEPGEEKDRYKLKNSSDFLMIKNNIQ